jgi:hypothetical protein
MPRWPRFISSWWLIPAAGPPMAAKSRPEENDFPFAHHAEARTSRRVAGSSMDLEQGEVHRVIERVVLGGVTVPGPSRSSRTHA